MAGELDVAAYSRRTQVTFEEHGIDVLGVIKRYLGDGEYEIEDEEGNIHEMLDGSFTPTEEE